MDLQHLADVHTGGNAQGVQDNVQGAAVRQVGHILLGQHAGNDALVAVASRHFIPHADLPLLGDVAADHLVNPGGKLVAVFAGKDLHVHNDAVFAVGHLQGGVPDLAGLFAKDGTEEAFLGVELGLPLGGHLAHQDIPGVNLGPHPDDAPLVQLPQHILPHVGDVAGNLLRPQLGVPGLNLVFLDVDGGVNVVAHHLFVDEHRVLVVVALPGHKADEGVFAQGDLPVLGGGAVGQDVPHFHPLPLGDDGPLVDAGALVGAQELDDVVGD